MNRHRVPLLALTLSHAALIVGLAATYDRLPQQVASHFNAAGTADGWMPRSAYAAAMAGVGVGVSLLIVAAFYSTRFFPSAINLPNRDYWLAPERRTETLSVFFRFGVWLAALEAMLILCLHLLVVSANASQPVRLSSSVWFLTAAFLLAVGVLSMTFIRRFRRVKER